VVSSQQKAVRAPDVVRASVDLGRFPWIRPLVGAYSHDFASVQSLFAGNPAEPEAWRRTIARVQAAPRDRHVLAAMLGRQLSERGSPPAAVEAAGRLTDPTSVAVVTGQQAGVFGGPLYTLLKAVTAIQLARQVTARYGVTAVPVFWVDSEDHDWDEVRTAQVLDTSFEVRSVTLGDLEGAGRRPVASLRLDETIDATLSSLEAALPSTEFTGEVLAALRACYRPGISVSVAFATWLDHLLGRHGLVVYDAADPTAKPLLGDLFARELDKPCQTADLATAAGQAMAALGHAPQVEPSDDCVALFYLDEAGRHPIRRAEGQYVIGELGRSPAEVKAEAAAHPERFSPNVLLRPVVQDRLFPTVCYVSGPSELAYQAQLKGIYEAFGVELPLLYSRATATLLDSGAMRFLSRNDVPIEALHAQDEHALNQLLESQLPPGIEQSLEQTGAAMVDRAAVMKRAVVQLDPTLAGAVDTTLAHMQRSLKTLHDKIIQASKRKDETLRRQFNRTRVLAFPSGHPQERVLSVVFFVNRYGQALCDRLVDVLPLETDRHYLLTL